MLYKFLTLLYPKLPKNSKRKNLIDSIGAFELSFHKKLPLYIASVTNKKHGNWLLVVLAFPTAMLYLFLLLLGFCFAIAAYLADVTPILFSTIKRYKR